VLSAFSQTGHSATTWIAVEDLAASGVAISNAKRTGPLQEAAITEFTAAKKTSARGCSFLELSSPASTHPSILLHPKRLPPLTLAVEVEGFSQRGVVSLSEHRGQGSEPSPRFRRTTRRWSWRAGPADVPEPPAVQIR
jgi:hypothetical protein